MEREKIYLRKGHLSWVFERWVRVQQNQKKEKDIPVRWWYAQRHKYMVFSTDREKGDDSGEKDWLMNLNVGMQKSTCALICLHSQRSSQNSSLKGVVFLPLLPLYLWHRYGKRFSQIPAVPWQGEDLSRTLSKESSPARAVVRHRTTQLSPVWTCQPPD